MSREAAGTPAAAASRLTGRTVALFALAALILRLLVLRHPLVEIDDLTLIDDSYLSLHLARNIAHGLGPWYGTAPTNGFQPLFVFLVAPFYAMWPGDHETPLRAALVLLAVADVAAMLVFHRLVRERTSTRLAEVALLAVWCVNPYVIKVALNGLETALATLATGLVLLLISRLDRPKERPPRALDGLGLGLMLGIGALARIDVLLLAPVAAWRLFLSGRASGASVPLALRRVAMAAAGAVIAMLPWLLYSWRWTGTIFPVSGRAVRYLQLSNVDHAPTLANLYLPLASRALEIVLRWNGVLLVALAAALAAAYAFSRRSPARTLAPAGPALAFALLVGVAYVGFVFGPWHFARYLFPLCVALMLCFALAADALATRAAEARGRAPRAIAAALVALLAAALMLQPPFAKLYRPRPPMWGYLGIGEWSARHFVPGTVIGASQSGALGYFADSLVVVNLDGVVNRDAYEAMRRGRLIEYVNASRIQYLVWQDDIEFIARESRDAARAGVTPLMQVPGIQTLGSPWTIYRVEP